MDHEVVRSLLRENIGSDVVLVAEDRLRGGSKKGVYRLRLIDDSTVILYVWSEAEDYWQRTVDPSVYGSSDVFGDASGLDLYLDAQSELSEAGVRTPAMLGFVRKSGEAGEDLALIEDVQGPKLEHLFQSDAEADRTVTGLRSMLDAMQRRRQSRYGKVAYVDASGAPQEPSEDIALRRAIEHLTHAASHIDRLRGRCDEIEHALRQGHDLLAPRSEYSLIHGELGPDHVLTDLSGDPVLIDIEGTMFFDVEWEHAFLRLRFGRHYERLRTEELDRQRLAFYALCLYLSLCSGPLRLLTTDFPDRDAMQRIIDVNADRVLDAL